MVQVGLSGLKMGFMRFKEVLEGLYGVPEVSKSVKDGLVGLQEVLRNPARVQEVLKPLQKFPDGSKTRQNGSQRS